MGTVTTEKTEQTKKQADQRKPKRRVYLFFKGVFDFICALILSLLLLPVFLIIALLILIEDGAPVFFKQERVGKNKKPFKIFKFRTMRKDTPKNVPTHLLENPDQWITKIGRFLRKSSLDELPQLFNVLLGHLYIVSYRPALGNQTDLNALRDEYGVHAIRPGITGYAQIHGRDELEIEKKAELDAYYVDHIGPVMDLKCIFGTVGAVLHSDGVVEGGTGSLNKKENDAADKGSEPAEEKTGE